MMAGENNDRPVELEPAAGEAVDYQAKYVRLQADMDNYRKRLDRNLAENVRQRKAIVLRGFLPVLDNLTRALEAGEVASVVDDSLREGVRLIADQFSAVLDGHGVSRIPSGGKFDPHLHEVMATVERDDVEEGDIVEELVAGYLLNGEVLRATGVRVATAPAGEAEGPAVEPEVSEDEASLDVKA